MLGEQQRSALRQALLVLERDLDGSQAAAAEGAATVDLDEPIGRLSRMDAIQQQKMVEASRAQMQRRLQLVRGALRRLRDDEYGECVTCGEDIGFARLEAQPEAPFCLACQSERERRS